MLAARPPPATNVVIKRDEMRVPTTKERFAECEVFTVRCEPRPHHSCGSWEMAGGEAPMAAGSFSATPSRPRLPFPIADRGRRAPPSDRIPHRYREGHRDFPRPTFHRDCR